MTDSNSLTPVDDQDYNAIENAVMETARGRWFLAEYTKRHRSADTEMLLAAIRKLEGSLKRDGKVPNIDTFKLDIADMASAIERTKKEIAQIADKGDHGDRFSVASNELDAIVEHTESATQEILNTAEHIQETCFEMRESGVDEKVCDLLEEYTTNIYMACSFQDLTGQRTQKVVHVLSYLESRVTAMINIWHSSVDELVPADSVPIYEKDTRPDAELLNGPQMAGVGVDQNEVDNMFSGVAGEEEDASASATETETPANADVLPDDGGATEDEMDLASFEAEALAEAEEAPAEAEEANDPEASTIEDDLEFAAPAGMPEGMDEPAGNAEEASEPVDLTDEAADVFETSEAAAPADEDVAPLDETDADFEGADVFELSEAQPEVSDLSDEVELTMDDIVEGWSEKDLDTDPTLELTDAERLALLH